jgi:Na+/proline symporter
LGILSTLGALALISLVGRTNSLFMIMNKVINGLGSPLLALFLLGMFSRRANAPGMLVGGLIGLAGSLLCSLKVEPLALHYYAVANLLVTLVPCYVFSVFFALAGFAPTAEQREFMWHRKKEGDRYESD